MPHHIDETDREIINLLREDARRPVADIARRVSLSPAATTRRIGSLERSGVIVGYTVRLDESRTGLSLEAFTELRYAGDMDQNKILAILANVEEVEDAYAVAGDTDALVHVRADDISHLKRVISKLRAQGNPIATRTLIVIESRPGEARLRRRPASAT